MKRIICFSAFFVFIIVIICGFYLKSHIYVINKEIAEEISNGILYVNGKEITDENVTIHYRKDCSSTFDLPFTEVLKGLGYNVKWINNNVAEIIYKNEKYILDLKKVSLIKSENTDNLIMPIDGGPEGTIIALEKELILDSRILKNTVEKMDKKIIDDCDFDKSIVYIIEKDD